MTFETLWDCHMHSSCSADSTTPMETMIQEAIRRGLSGICFTEHFDPDYPPTPDAISFDLNLPSYKETFFSLKERYQNQIDLRFGIELGLQPHLAGQFHALLSNTPEFDFVIGSSHVLHGFDPYYPEFFEGRDEQACYHEYFVSILENLHAFSEMDAYGHLDYIVRYGPNKNRFYEFKKHEEILTEILKTLIDKSIALEVNTGGFAYGLGQPNPSIEILKTYKRLGGELLTLGADAHRPDRIAFDFPRAVALLKECGFEHYTVFQNRIPK